MHIQPGKCAPRFPPQRSRLFQFALAAGMPGPFAQSTSLLCRGADLGKDARALAKTRLGGRLSRFHSGLAAAHLPQDAPGPPDILLPMRLLAQDQGALGRLGCFGQLVQPQAGLRQEVIRLRQGHVTARSAHFQRLAQVGFSGGIIAQAHLRSAQVVIQDDFQVAIPHLARNHQ